MKRTTTWCLVLPLLLAPLGARADRLLDPTRPVTAKDASAPAVAAMRLEAIMRSEDRLVAIVNGRIVRAGDRIGEARIDEVRADSVLYTRAGQRNVLRLSNQSIQVRQNVAHHEDET